MRTLREVLRHPRLARLRGSILLIRGLLFLGRRFRCPCCGWTLRGFVGRWGFLSANHDGYCPRCNAKARHRRIWLFLQEQCRITQERLRLLEVGPWWSLSRQLQRLPEIFHVGLDLQSCGPQVTVVGDAVDIPAHSKSFDAALCIHVLEHVHNDRGVLAELYRVLRPGSWALVSVPIRLDRLTHEDPSITDPEERARVFGERGHVRYYGHDLQDRLLEAGFEVTLYRASELATSDRERCGLRDDENLFLCRRPAIE